MRARQMRLADAGRPEQDDVFRALDERQAPQAPWIWPRGAPLGVGEVELLERFRAGQRRELQQDLARPTGRAPRLPPPAGAPRNSREARLVATRRVGAIAGHSALIVPSFRRSHSCVMRAVTGGPSGGPPATASYVDSGCCRLSNGIGRTVLRLGVVGGGCTRIGNGTKCCRSITSRTLGFSPGRRVLAHVGHAFEPGDRCARSPRSRRASAPTASASPPAAPGGCSSGTR